MHKSLSSADNDLVGKNISYAGGGGGIPLSLNSARALYSFRLSYDCFPIMYIVRYIKGEKKERTRWGRGFGSNQKCILRFIQVKQEMKWSPASPELGHWL